MNSYQDELVSRLIHNVDQLNARVDDIEQSIAAFDTALDRTTAILLKFDMNIRRMNDAVGNHEGRLQSFEKVLSFQKTFNEDTIMLMRSIVRKFKGQ